MTGSPRRSGGGVKAAASCCEAARGAPSPREVWGRAQAPPDLEAGAAAQVSVAFPTESVLP